jgi:hypothetical protein
MYDFYPEWGPARHRDQQDRPAVRRPRYWQPDGAVHRVAARPAAVSAVSGASAGPEARDGAFQRPDDN